MMQSEKRDHALGHKFQFEIIGKFMTMSAKNLVL